MQVLVIGFGTTEATGEIAAELKRLREADIVRLVDLIVVAKDTEGDVVAIETSDLSKEEAMELGAIAGALIGLGAAGDEGVEAGAIAGAARAEAGETPLGDEVWFLEEAIPPGTTAAVAVIEHRWAIPLRDAVIARGGVPLADSWLHPADLVALGIEKAAAAA